MGRSFNFDQLKQTLRLAHFLEQHDLPTDEGLAMRDDMLARSVSRRQFLKGAATAAAVALVTPPRLTGVRPPPALDVGIVGAGLAGLACADALKRRGVNAVLYDAADRTGGRCWSLRGYFPGQVAERGGELVDNLHKTMLGYARRFGLRLEDIGKQPGEVFYYFEGQHIPESVIVDEYRDFVRAMRIDLRALSPEVTAINPTPDDIRLDNINLLDYLEGNNGAGLPAAPAIKHAIIEAYEAEYGLAADQQSALNFLMFIHADRRSKFTPFGIFSDERYHLVDGNDGVVAGLTAGLAGQINLEMQLLRIVRTGGRIELTFDHHGSTVTRVHDAVVVTIPFSVLRDIDLDVSLNLPPEKLLAINQLGYGTNAKMMVGFTARPWAALGSSGAAYADLANVQTTWETNPTRATATRAILTDYSSAARGANLDPNNVQVEAQQFLSGLDLVYPGAQAAATVQGGQYLVHLEHWPSNPFTKGSYTCYRTGQFTTIAGYEAPRVGNLLFAGEHTDSFYSWQGFMEGAALSGLRAANELLR